jgi:cobalt-precorrin 5A hydrolase/precorrin-3B C17-methyltransferase
VSIFIGIGHDAGARLAELEALVTECLKAAGVDRTDIAMVSSIDSRAETGLADALAASLGVAARYFPAARLEEETPRLANPSEALFQRIGCHGVAEAAALAAAGPDARLILPKRKGRGVTCAIAESGENRG